VSDTVAIEIRQEVLHATRMTLADLKRELAICLFRQEKLSFGKAREMADVPAWTFQQMLSSRGIPVHYGVEEYEQDLSTLRELGRL